MEFKITDKENYIVTSYPQFLFEHEGTTYQVHSTYYNGEPVRELEVINWDTGEETDIFNDYTEFFKETLLDIVNDDNYITW